MESTLTEEAAVGAADPTLVSPWHSLFDGGHSSREPGTDEALHSAFQDELDDPGLVLSPGYIGPDRRTSGLRARLSRATFRQRRSVLSLEFVVVAVVVTLVIASVLLVDPGGRPPATASETAAKSSTPLRTDARAKAPAAVTPAPTPTTTVPAPTTTVPAPTSTVASSAPAPVPAPAAAPAAAPAPAPAPTTTLPAPTAPTAALTPAQMGAQALTLIRYPWQGIPGYNIQFLPISDAPSAGFYGNTTFTWGRTGGTSVLYVYPGETVDRLAGITAFEIGHEVDAAAVEPQGGEAQIENILGIHPASWAPDCDCGEQGFLSGWYAAAFSNYWSPGVGDWSQIAPEPSGAVLTSIEPWLNPTIS
jgi:hypothetical protein